MKKILILLSVIVFFASCKKEAPYYKISDGMKQFFVFQKGSYWIYENDSTNITDSTYVNNTIYSKQGIGDDGRHLYSFDMISIYLTSQFLNDFQIGYFCVGPDCLLVSSKIINSGQNQDIGIIAYFAGWKPNQFITSQECLVDDIFSYKFITTDTINNTIYSNIIYSKTTGIDSTFDPPHTFFREIYFAKNIGIIKFVEDVSFYNIHRSWSLKNYKVIQ